MNKMVIFSGIMLISVFISSVSQLILKMASGKTYENRSQEYLNFRVIFAYALFFLSTIITILALKYIPLSLAPVLESAGYVFVSILSYIFLSERFKKRQIIGMLIIICGVIVYSMEF